MISGRTVRWFAASRRGAIVAVACGLAAGLAGAPGSTAAASFDCARAGTPDEKTVCADPALSRADETVAKLYSNALAQLKGDDRDAAVAAQRAWLAARKLCAADVPCLTAIYAAAVARLDPPGRAAPAAAATDAFARTGICSPCDLAGADLGAIEPFGSLDGDCSIDGVVTGTLRKANMAGANFLACVRGYTSRLKTMTWDGADLAQANLAGANLTANSLVGTDLTGADLSRTTLFLADFSSARLSGADLSGAESKADAMHGWGSSFVDADFSRAKLGKASLYGDFQGADFTGADLRGATIDGYVAGSDDEDAGTTTAGEKSSDGKTPPPPRFGGKVDLTGADLTGATLFAKGPPDFAGAILCRTTMPDGKRSDRDC